MRSERVVEGCLLSAENTKSVSEKGPVLVCEFCTNRSDMVGNLGATCRVPKDVKNA